MDESTRSKRDSTPLNSRKSIQSDIKKHATSSPTSGKIAIVILVIVVMGYMYQVCVNG